MSSISTSVPILNICHNKDVFSVKWWEITAGRRLPILKLHKLKLWHSGKWPTWRTISSIICLFESSTCFEQLRAHLQEDNCFNTTSGIITVLVAYRYTGPPLTQSDYTRSCINPLKAELNPICYLPALLGAHHFLHVSRIRVKSLTLGLIMPYIYIYGAPILDVSRSHTTTHHSR